MGNIVQRRKRDRDNDYPTPELPELSPKEIEIVQKTWKIPSVKVTFELCEINSPTFYPQLTIFQLIPLYPTFSAARFGRENFLRISRQVST